MSGLKLSSLLLCAALLPGLSGCHLLHNRFSSTTCDERQHYQGERSVAPLKIPPGLDTPETTNALHLPTLNEPAPPPRRAHDPCLDLPPSFKVAKPTPQA